LTRLLRLLGPSRPTFWTILGGFRDENRDPRGLNEWTKIGTTFRVVRDVGDTTN